MDDLNRKRHAVYKLTYHAVFVIKYRRRVMTEPIITHMRQYATHLIEQCYQGKLLELNGEPDHIHILFELPATAAPSVVVCSLKTQLSKEVRAKFWDEIKDKLWKDSFWSDSYFITTTGGANFETLERYIQDQGIEKPKRKYIQRQAKKIERYIQDQMKNPFAQKKIENIDLFFMPHSSPPDYVGRGFLRRTG